MATSSSNELATHIQAAVRHLGWAVRPILTEDNRGRADLLGSAVLCAVADSHFLITAAHVWDKKREGRRLYLGTRSQGVEIDGPARWSEAPRGLRLDDMIDLAFVELSPSIVAQAEGCVFLTPGMLAIDDVADPTPGRLPHYLMLGYPASKLDARPPFTSVTPHPLLYATVPLAADAYSRHGIHEYSHIISSYDRKNSQSVSGQRTAPDPHGCSGGGLFRLMVTAPYRPGSAQLAGILFEYRKDEGLVISTRIGLLVEGLRFFRPALSPFLPRTRRVTVTNTFR